LCWRVTRERCTDPPEDEAAPEGAGVHPFASDEGLVGDDCCRFEVHPGGTIRQSVDLPSV
jgi:hypothetical protein